ncbi:hypothetical protein, partial [Salipiger sp. PrR007]|uniref:hypothetical protein n=1 Tax=Salipiger sp. PrR007 TaxID=2706884 RepID=UPI001942A15E
HDPLSIIQGGSLLDGNPGSVLGGNQQFNNRRLLEPIGNIPPAEAETNFYAALEAKDMAA